MFQYIQHKDIDYKLWDDCIDNSKNGIIYALSWYLDIACVWDGIIKQENGKYVAVMPVPVFIKFGIKYVKQPILCQQLGVFSKDHKLTNTDYESILQLLKKRFWYIQRYEFNTGNMELLSVKASDFRIESFTTYHLDLKRSYEEIFAGYKTDRKWRINKANRSSILINPSNDIDGLIKIFDENVAHKIYGIKGDEYEYKILRSLFYETKRRKMEMFYAAENDNGEILAMGLFFIYNNKIIYIFNASTSRGKHMSAISLVVDKVLREYSEQALCFDFESPEIPHVAEFYRRFGSEPVHFPSISYNNLPRPISY